MFSKAAFEKNHTLSDGLKDAKSNLKQFDYYDDSSDEDEIEDSLSKYNVVTSWKKKANHAATKSKNKELLNNDELLSFVVHAAGIKLLYSSNVNKRYYMLKKALLCEMKEEDSAISQIEKLVRHAVMRAINNGFETAQSFLGYTQQKKTLSSYLLDVQKKVELDFNMEINKLILSRINVFIDWIKKNNFFSQNSKPNDVRIFENELSTAFLNIFKKHAAFELSKYSRSEVRLEGLYLINAKINEISQKLKFYQKLNAKGMLEALNTLANCNIPYKNMLSGISAILQEHPARGNIHTIIMKKMADEECQNKLLQCYLKDLNVINSARGKKNTLIKNERAFLNRYYSVNDESMCDEVSRGFSQALKSNLSLAIESLERPTLGKSHLFISDNPVSFYANLRLSNRSQKRRAENSKYALYKYDCVSRAWRLGPTFPSECDVVETQEILTSSGRKDRVEAVGNYEKVYEDIAELKKYFNANAQVLSDAMIAEWMRLILNGIQPAFTNLKLNHSVIFHKLQAITYLIFGCEPSRNPAMHVINQMLLDLIIANNGWTFEEAFSAKVNGVPVGKNIKLMPMVPEGSVACARALESDYRAYMPYHYRYNGVEAHDKENKGKLMLIELEARIVRDWIELTADNSIKTAKNLSEWLLIHIGNYTKKWTVLKSQPEDELVTSLTRLVFKM